MSFGLGQLTVLYTLGRLATTSCVEITSYKQKGDDPIAQPKLSPNAPNVNSNPYYILEYHF